MVLSTQELPEPVERIISDIRVKVQERFAEFRTKPIREQAFIAGGGLLGVLLIGGVTKSGGGTIIGLVAGVFLGKELATRPPILLARK